MGRLQFEDNWKDAFEGVESTVPLSVWEKVEVDLIRAENKDTKSMVVLYQRIAASVALFALALASYIAYDRVAENSIRIDQKNESQMAENSTRMIDKEIVNDQKLIAKENNDSAPKALDEAISHTNSSQVRPHALSEAQNNWIADVEDETSIAPRQDKSDRKRDGVTRDLASWSSPKIKLQRTKFYEPNFPRQLPAMPSFFMASKDNNDKDLLFASLGLAGGSYNPGVGTSSQSNSIAQADSKGFAANGARPQSTQASTGSAYSLGVSVGKQIGKRWVLQTGLNYINQSIDYTSNYTLASSNKLSPAIADYSRAETIAITYSSPYTIRSSIEFVAIPIQAGYQIVDRKLGLQLNAGVSTDFFLNNTLKDESGQSDNFSQGAGEDSPYRSLNWSGLMNFEVSHKLADRYSISIIPGFRYSLNSILKDGSEFAYKPLVLDVGLRMRYIFK
ncbi:MAG: outer membrane beta-barrel protein [Cyclobacteriaceae bacterium]